MMADSKLLPGSNGLPQQCEQTSKVIHPFSPVFVLPELYKALRDRTDSYIVDDGDHTPTSTGPDRPIHLLCCIKFEDANGMCTPRKSLGVIQVVKDIDTPTLEGTDSGKSGTDLTDSEVKDTNLADDSEEQGTDLTNTKEKSTDTPEAKGIDSTDAPIPKTIYYVDKSLRVTYTSKGLKDEKLELVSAVIPPLPADKFTVQIEHWQKGIVGKFRPVIGGIMAAVISKKNAPYVKFFDNEKDLQKQVEQNRTTGPDWQFTIADVTINQGTSLNTPPIAIFYYAEKLNPDKCYYVVPDPEKKCVKLSEESFSDKTIMHHRQWSYSYSNEPTQ